MKKSTYMYWQKRLDQPDKNAELEEKIKKLFEEHHGNYGYRRITKELYNQGEVVNKKKVQRIMRKLGLKCVAYTRKSRKYSSYKGKVGQIAKNRVHRRFHTHIPHQKVTTDTTEFKYYERDKAGNIQIKKAYLDPFLDMYNSEIISYSFSKQPSAVSIMQALNKAIDFTSDCPYRRTFHSDQGWAYQMHAYVNKLKEYRVFQSMSRKGNCLDNSLMENFFGIMKQEMYYGKVYSSFKELQEAVVRYIDYYNNKRIKEKLNWMSPVQFRINNQAYRTSVPA